MKITIAQMSSVVGDLENNKKKIISIYKDSAADVVVFPEMAISGYFSDDLFTLPSYTTEIEI